MKDLKKIRATNQFQAIIDRYQKNKKKVKGKDSLNTLFVKDLNKIKGFSNFSDEEEYMINEIKNENKIRNEKLIKNNNEISSFPNRNISNEKISKDIFFYYRNKLNKVNNGYNDLRNYEQISLRNKSASQRVNSGKRSVESYNTRNSNSKRRKSNKSLILPLIYSRNYNNMKSLKNNKSFISDEETTNIVSFNQSDKNNKSEASEEIENEISKNIKRNEKNMFYKYSKNNNNKYKENNFYKLSIKDLLNNYRMKKREKELFYMLNLPLIENDIFNKMHNVTKKSENISKKINYISTEGNIAYENEKNRIKFLKEISEF
jgi:hypothetical protein